MNFSSKNLRSALVAVVASATLPLSGQTFIDKFLDEDIIDSLNHPTLSTRTSDLSGLPNVLGGERRFSETRIATLAGSNSNIALSHGATIESGIGFEFSNGTHSRSEVVLEYGLSAGVKFDFSSFAPGSSFQLLNWRSDQPNVLLALTLRSNVGNALLEQSQTKTLVLPAVAFPSATSVDLALSLFNQIDFANIDDITLTFTSQTIATDAGASAFLVAIPEPQTYALLVGLVTLGVIQFRRRNLA